MIFEYDDRVIVLSEVSLVIKNVEILEYPNQSEYTVYFKGSANSLGIKKVDIERFKSALREYYKSIAPKLIERSWWVG